MGSRIKDIMVMRRDQGKSSEGIFVLVSKLIMYDTMIIGDGLLMDYLGGESCSY